MELEPHTIATENRGRSHPTSSDPLGTESGGSSTTNELQAYNLARDRQRCTNVKPPSRLGYEGMISFALLVSGDEPTTFHRAITSQEKKEWMGAMVEKMESLHKNQTWELVQLLEGKKAIRCKAILTLVASWDLHLEQMDVKTAFFHGDLEEQIYMEQSDGFTQPGHEHLNGYKWCEYDRCVYVKSFDDGSSIFLLLYVDDLLIAAKNMYDVFALKTLFSQEFDMKDLGAATKILEWRFTETEAQGNCGYINEAMLKKWYLKGTVGHGVVFGSQQNDLLVVGYVDSDYAGDLDDRRSTTGYDFTLGGGSICWKSTVQSIVALSTIEAEYMAVAEAAKEALWLSGLSKNLMLSKVEFSCIVTVKV
ncbi:UNVERIFIED_CONTAM: Retrovirus-related Pol polyprotein from transposon TNT 1-94 [Sesamum angustifolium]|uniref:Retrovirus-related Pol polyprotein from transposon TNT 1-94 n=1 Tax=Sesamum angustifolium TaxID=2727405 RepID=A0AAW2Q7U7_9LAMI